MKCVYILALFFTAVYGGVEDFRRIDSVIQEAPCRKAGGMCVVSGDCPEDGLSDEPGLCPQQQKQGIECCHGMSKRETRCNRRGGVCMPKTEFCGPSVLFARATDCPPTHNCCIMVL